MANENSNTETMGATTAAVTPVTLESMGISADAIKNGAELTQDQIKWLAGADATNFKVWFDARKKAVKAQRENDAKLAKIAGAAAKEAKKATKAGEKPATEKKTRPIGTAALVCFNAKHGVVTFAQADAYIAVGTNWADDIRRYGGIDARACPLCHGYARNIRDGFLANPTRDGNIGDALSVEQYLAKGGVFSYSAPVVAGAETPAPTGDGAKVEPATETVPA